MKKISIAIDTTYMNGRIAKGTSIVIRKHIEGLVKYLPSNLVDRPKQGVSFPFDFLQNISPERILEIMTEVYEHCDLTPFRHGFLKKLAQNAPYREKFWKEHPQVSYTMLMWYSWRKNFLNKI